MNKYVEYIKKEFNECNDLKYKNIKINFKTYHLFYLETLCSSDRINNFIFHVFLDCIDKLVYDFDNYELWSEKDKKIFNDFETLATYNFVGNKNINLMVIYYNIFYLIIILILTLLK